MHWTHLDNGCLYVMYLGLKPFTRYVVQLAALNMNGTGAYTNASAVTDEGGKNGGIGRAFWYTP